MGHVPTGLVRSGKLQYAHVVRPDLAQKYGFTEDLRSDVPSDYPQAPAAMPASPHHKTQSN